MILRSTLTTLISGILLTIAVGAEDAPSHLGKQIAPFTLDNCYGKPVSLSDFDDKKAVVVVFLGVECPLAKLYGPRLAQLQAEFEDQGVVVLGLNANTQDSMTELQAYVHRHDVNYEFLKDVGNRVADAFGAQRTPEAFLLDKNHVVRYHGSIDDQYLVGKTRERSIRPYLRDALVQLLEDQEIVVPETEPEGCFIGRVSKSEPIGDITYTKHIAPIFNARCVRCHREQEIAPFTLTSYEDIQGWEDTILEVIEDKRMPPWFAEPNPKHGKFANDAQLSEREKELIATWVDNGMPEGDPADLPTPPQFTLGWQIPEPDVQFDLSDCKVVSQGASRYRKSNSLKMTEAGYHIPAEGVVDYQYCTVKTNWREDKYVHAAEARPGNRSVVHHIIVFVIPPGQEKNKDRHMLAGYAPGALPLQLPKGVAFKIPAGSTLLFQMHYTPNGQAQTDRSKVGLCFMDESEVERQAMQLVALKQEISIPAGAHDHQETAYTKVNQDMNLVSMTPHMHLRGKAFKYEAIYPDKTSDTLLNVPAYDFNWQLKYTWNDPVLLPAGTIIKCTARYDNSEQNLSNPDPTKTVRWGDQSFEEMMIGFMEVIPPLSR